MFTYPNFDPVAFSIGPVAVRWYGIMYLAGFLFTWLGLRARAKLPWSKVGPAQVDDVVFYAALGAIVGGRIGYMFVYGLSELVADPLSLFTVWKGGMSFHGGLSGVLIAMAIYGRRAGLRFFDITDAIAPWAGGGIFFGRLGNFINGELWGRQTTVPWGVNFCNDRARQIYGATCEYMGQGPGDVVRHPSQLYEAGLEGVFLLGLLAFAIWKVGLLRKPGYVTGLFLLGYGLIRATLENVRQPDAGLDHLPLGLTMGMILSTPMMLIGAWLIWRAWSRPPVSA